MYAIVKIIAGYLNRSAAQKADIMIQVDENRNNSKAKYKKSVIEKCKTFKRKGDIIAARIIDTVQL